MWCALCMTSQDEWCNKWEGKEIKGENEHIRLVLRYTRFLAVWLPFLDRHSFEQRKRKWTLLQALRLYSSAKERKKWVLYCVTFEARKEWIWWKSCGCSYFFLLCLHYALAEYAMDVGLSDGISMFPYIFWNVHWRKFIHAVLLVSESPRPSQVMTTQGDLVTIFPLFSPL